MILIGLTGQTGAGKSTVSLMLRQQGFAIIDADECSHEETRPGSPSLKEIARVFGDDLVDENGVLNRGLLASRAFCDAQHKKQLEEILFPYIIENIKQKMALLKAKGYRLIVLDAPTLFESGVDAMCERIVSVTAPESVRLSRILQRDKVTREQALLRMSAQHSEEFYRSHSQHILENGGSKEELAAQVQTLCRLFAEVEGCRTEESLI